MTRILLAAVCLLALPAGAQSAPSALRGEKRIEWLGDLDAAKALAATTRKPILLAIVAAWWGIWHILVGTTLASIWRRFPPRVPAPAEVPA